VYVSPSAAASSSSFFFRSSSSFLARRRLPHLPSPSHPARGTWRSPTCSPCSRRVRRRYRRLYACTCTCTPPGVPPLLHVFLPFSSLASRAERRTGEGSRHPEESGRCRGARTRRGGGGGQQATDETRARQREGRTQGGNGKRRVEGCVCGARGKRNLWRPHGARGDRHGGLKKNGGDDGNAIDSNAAIKYSRDLASLEREHWSLLHSSFSTFYSSSSSSYFSSSFPTALCDTPRTTRRVSSPHLTALRQLFLLRKRHLLSFFLSSFLSRLTPLPCFEILRLPFSLSLSLVHVYTPLVFSRARALHVFTTRTLRTTTRPRALESCD